MSRPFLHFSKSSLLNLVLRLYCTIVREQIIASKGYGGRARDFVTGLILALVLKSSVPVICTNCFFCTFIWGHNAKFSLSP
jgi:hypothetical protein